MKKLKSLLYVTVSGLGVYTAVSIYRGNEKFYKNNVMPLVHLLDAEQAHRLAIWASKYRLLPKNQLPDPDILKIKVFGKEFQNPIGIAAGFDKNAEAILGLSDLGVGFVEIGSVTPQPQPGNDKPRVFRLIPDLAVINRYGFNSDGHEAVHQRLNEMRRDRSDAGTKPLIIGVNLGKNKSSPDPYGDYVSGVERFGAIADYLVINISSPNTPGLRTTMQDRTNLQQLLSAVNEKRKDLPMDQRPPLLLKLSPNLSDAERKVVADVIKRKECNVDGLIVSNTTVVRSETLKSGEQLTLEAGGLSGRPLKDVSTQMISDMYRLTKGLIPIIGVGGISSGKDAYEKIKAGASIVQVYTAIVFEGPPIIGKIKRELIDLIAADGYDNVAQAVGKNVKL